MGCGGSEIKLVGDEKARVVFVIGGPGSGKGTICKKLVEEFKYIHLSTGDILRKVVKEKKIIGWEEIERTMKNGDLVPSDQLLSFCKIIIASSIEKKILFDGFPRNQENLDEWNKTMTDFADIKGCLYLECKDNVMIERALNRNEGRDDDIEQTIKRRIYSFRNETLPVIKYFNKIDLLIEVSTTTKTADEVLPEITREFIERKLYV